MSHFGAFQTLPKSLLRTLQQRAKSLTALDLEKHEQLLHLNVSQALCFIKSCSHIQSLTLLGHIQRLFSSMSYLKWLTQSKQLTHLTLGPIPKPYDSLAFQSRLNNPLLLRAAQTKYHKTLKRTKLLSLDLKSPEFINPQFAFLYPSTLRELSIYLHYSQPRFHLNLSHLHNLHHLSTFHLPPILFSNNPFKILQSLPNPHKITHLTTYTYYLVIPKLQESLTNFPSISPKRLLARFRLYLLESFPDLLKKLHFLPSPHKITHFTAYVPDIFYPNDPSPQHLIESLARFQSLSSLNLGINSFLPVSSLSKSLTSSSNLRELSLYIPIQKQKQLIELAELIGNHRNLSLLAIVNTKTIEGYASKGHRIFFTQISEMSRLKSLKINLCGGGIDSLKPQFFMDVWESLLVVWKN